MSDTPSSGDNGFQNQPHSTSASTNTPNRTFEQQGNDLYGTGSEHQPQTETSPAAPSQQRIDEVCNKLFHSIKVNAVTDCPVHPARDFCDRPAGLAALSASDVRHSKINLFGLFWDVQLPGGCVHAYDYTGDQNSHHVFVEKVGKTPKHFARSFLKEGGSGTVGVLFVPSGRMNETVVAMVEYWVVRNAQWKALYSSREEAHETWLKDTYDLSRQSPRFENVADMMLEKPEVGSMIPTYECQYGPPGHVCTIHLMPFKDIAGGITVKVLALEKCHVPCPISAPRDDHSREQGADVNSRQLRGFDDVQQYKEFVKDKASGGNRGR
ncbi:hypothetical protein LTR37_015806 [Vermiconidia calcicola]|uniref:Uncharacterized protein n=1 Tax=Vermiconidia calcicola TaxID=1690605 RepID=A0ACC3MQI7_9PEZI|nr:hypothetical protein LTR37_015806 [Vermiconidia calcicola]